MSTPTLREIVTPEGVPVRFVVASAGDRLGAFAIDAALIVGASLLMTVVAAPVTLAVPGLGLALWILVLFLLRSFYFTWFECRGGTTPGKRALGLRVIDAHGGTLTPESVFARNLTREIELFMPIVVLLLPEALLPDVPRWLRIPGLLWILVFALFPLTNRDHLRMGDLVGGTLVVHSPRPTLLRDLSAAPSSPQKEPSRVSFTADQLDVYGITQLHVLEKVLRNPGTHRDALDALAQRVQVKIAWEDPPGIRVGAEEFLQAFYTAQRARLEQRLLLGERRQDKRRGRLSRRR